LLSNGPGIEKPLEGRGFGVRAGEIGYGILTEIAGEVAGLPVGGVQVAVINQIPGVQGLFDVHWADTL
jgi:hypothetical protein